MPEDRQQTVIGVLPDTQAHAGMRRIIEYAKQNERIRSVMIRKIGSFKAEAEANVRNQNVPEPRHRSHVVQHGLPEFRHPLRKKVWPVERRSSLHKRVVLTQLRAKIDAFFQVGLARGEFASQREISPPSPAAT